MLGGVTEDKEYIDPRLIKRLHLPKGQWADVRLDAVGQMLAGEADELLAAYDDSIEHTSYVRREVQLAALAVRRGTEAAYLSDWLTAWLHARLVAESAIRLAWLARGADTTEVVRRLHRLEKRDLLLMLKADEAIAADSEHRMIVNPEILKSRAAGLAKDPAPMDLRRLAHDADESGIYALHRWASTIVHPGFGNHQLYRKMPFTELLKGLHLPFAVLAGSALKVLRTLAPDVKAPRMPAAVAILEGGGLLDLKPLQDRLKRAATAARKATTSTRASTRKRGNNRPPEDTTRDDDSSPSVE